MKKGKIKQNFKKLIFIYSTQYIYNYKNKHIYYLEAINKKST